MTPIGYEPAMAKEGDRTLPLKSGARSADAFHEGGTIRHRAMDPSCSRPIDGSG
jgi:hypothetical protein